MLRKNQQLAEEITNRLQIINRLSWVVCQLCAMKRQPR
jgi:hypothetical protein